MMGIRKECWERDDGNELWMKGVRKDHGHPQRGNGGGGKGVGVWLRKGGEVRSKGIGEGDETSTVRHGTMCDGDPKGIVKRRPRAELAGETRPRAG